MNQELAEQLHRVRNLLMAVQHEIAQLTGRPYIRTFDAIIAAYDAQKHVAEAAKLVGFIEFDERDRAKV